jgi:hypothetical protein
MVNIMGVKSKLKAVVEGMSTNQKIVTVVIAVLIPLGGWFALGVPTTAVALGALGASEIAAVVGALKVIFSVE